MHKYFRLSYNVRSCFNFLLCWLFLLYPEPSIRASLKVQSLQHFGGFFVKRSPVGLEKNIGCKQYGKAAFKRRWCTLSSRTLSYLLHTWNGFDIFLPLVFTYTDLMYLILLDLWVPISAISQARIQYFFLASILHHSLQRHLSEFPGTSRISRNSPISEFPTPSPICYISKIVLICFLYWS